ncbi:hypothetical protein [Sphingomonas morindae]|uniref:Uncharacterized protein n=1 Tax=Sphingomonas morindae TaxID=1541170 RepID=A0ABY4XCZ5_9SPHN|nr:hypothetical protein [Sphingomonas morindae]USI74837.1 hypothetical protein LHA26_19005 [Sphingomonas morindae]
MVAATALLAAGPPRFSFQAIEFEPAAARLPEARAWLARVAAPGTPMAEAVRAVRAAGAGCATRPAGAVRCRYARTVQDSSHANPPGAVLWTVWLQGDANGRVVQANLDRARRGL